MFTFIKNSASLLKRKQEDILSAAFVIAFSFALSRILGLVRYRLLASYFGDNILLLDSFIAASVLTDAVFEVLIFGTIALAFIPVFTQYLTHDKQERAWELSSSMITLGLLVFIGLTAVLSIFAQSIAPIIAPGIVAKEPTAQFLIARLLRIMLVAQLFFVVSIFLTGILQSHKRFLIPALAAISYNVGIIISIIFLVPVFNIYAPAVGMIIGALLHLIIQLPLALALGFKFKLKLDLKNKDVRETIALMWPRTLALALTRVSDMINIALASRAILGSIVAFNFAQVLQYVPITIFASSIAQAALPSLAIEHSSKRTQEFKKLFIQSFHQIIFLVLPAAAILAVLRIPTVRLVFGARELPWEITVLAGRTLVAFSIGIIAQALSLLFTRSFYALRDSATPVRVNIVTVAVNVTLSLVFIFVFKLSIIWLAVAYSTANIINASIMFYLLHQKINFDLKEVLIPAAKMFFITMVTAVSLYIPMKLLDQLVFDTTRTIGLILLTGVATTVGLLVYISLSLLLKVDQVLIFYHLLKRVAHIPLKLTKSQQQDHVK